MTGKIALLDESPPQPDKWCFRSGRPSEVAEPRACDGCRDFKPDIDLFAEDTETGEELWLCEACGEW